MADDSMRLLTLTRLWLFGRYLHSIGDYALWTPIPHRAVGYALAVGAPWWGVLALLRVGFTGPGLTYHFVLPGLLVWWLLRAVAEGQRPSEVVASWARLGWHVARTRRVPAVVRMRERGSSETRSLVCLAVLVLGVAVLNVVVLATVALQRMGLL
jgi:hypothetical protein